MKEKDDIEAILQAVRTRFAELNDREQQSVSAHLRSIANWHREPNDYPEPHKMDFPATIHIAYAVCHPDCGTREFIVDGSTQECQTCGSLMFRTEVKKYTLSKVQECGNKKKST